jgi:hypothetical protein
MRGDTTLSFPALADPPHPHLPPGICKVSWENSTMQVVVTVFGLAIMTSPQAVIA